MNMESEKTLGQLFEALLDKGAILPSRKGPIKTALKQYSKILGYVDFNECPVAAYFKNDGFRNRLIDEGAIRTRGHKDRSIHLGQDAVRNLKNNVSFALRKAVEVGVIPPSKELFSANQRRNSCKRPCRNEHVISAKYRLDPVPSSFARALDEYDAWSTRIVNPARPGKLLKRRVSINVHREGILHVAGYLVKFKNLDRDSISLSTLVRGSNPIDFIAWYIEQQGKITRGARTHLSFLTVLAKYLVVTGPADQVEEIRGIVEELLRFRLSLGPPMAVVDKGKRWLSLRELEKVRLSVYPFNARRVADLADSTRERISRSGIRSEGSGRGLASAVLTSLLIGLDIRIPLRQRNLQEMLWNPSNPEAGQNLYRRNGKWLLRFSGHELKIPFIGGAVHSIEHEFPDDLVNLLEEWLWKWRPLQISGNRTPQEAKHCSKNGQEFVFLTMVGGPLYANRINEAVQGATYKFTGIAVNIHMIRTIWATEYIKATRNVIDAAFMLGDTVETVLRCYAKLLDQECGKRASEWMTKTLEN